jgi:hypothetical protein
LRRNVPIYFSGSAPRRWEVFHALLPISTSTLLVSRYPS